MALTLKSIGDLVYPQYAEVSSHFIKNALAITKGNIYTKDANGRLIVPVSTSGVADLTKGIYQAAASASAPSAEDTDRVQCYEPGSYILIKADANLVEGQEVELKSSGVTTTADKVMAAVSPHTKGFIGTIKEIYALKADGITRKQVTADNDLVIVKVNK